MVPKHTTVSTSRLESRCSKWKGMFFITGPHHHTRHHPFCARKTISCHGGDSYLTGPAAANVWEVRGNGSYFVLLAWDVVTIAEKHEAGQTKSCHFPHMWPRHQWCHQSCCPPHSWNNSVPVLAPQLPEFSGEADVTRSSQHSSLFPRASNSRSLSYQSSHCSSSSQSRCGILTAVRGPVQLLVKGGWFGEDDRWIVNVKTNFELWTCSKWTHDGETSW